MKCSRKEFVGGHGREWRLENGGRRTRGQPQPQLKLGEGKFARWSVPYPKYLIILMLRKGRKVLLGGTKGFLLLSRCEIFFPPSPSPKP